MSPVAGHQLCWRHAEVADWGGGGGGRGFWDILAGKARADIYITIGKIEKFQFLQMIGFPKVSIIQKPTHSLRIKQISKVRISISTIKMLERQLRWVIICKI